MKKMSSTMKDIRMAQKFLKKSPGDNVVVLLEKKGKLIDFVFGKNIVTSTGEIYYAQRSCNETPTNNYTDMYLCSAHVGNNSMVKTDNRSNFTDIGSTNKTKSANYPRTSDPDTDNTGNGANIASWLFSYAAGDFNASGIAYAYVTKNSPAANESLLCGITFNGNWTKDANTSAKVFVNHGQNGV
jgi:hypothetical protein